jgi:hypothetical protein
MFDLAQILVAMFGSVLFCVVFIGMIEIEEDEKE